MSVRRLLILSSASQVVDNPADADDPQPTLRPAVRPCMSECGEMSPTSSPACGFPDLCWGWETVAKSRTRHLSSLVGCRWPARDIHLPISGRGDILHQVLVVRRFIMASIGGAKFLRRRGRIRP